MTEENSETTERPLRTRWKVILGVVGSLVLLALVAVVANLVALRATTYSEAEMREFDDRLAANMTVLSPQPSTEAEPTRSIPAEESPGPRSADPASGGKELKRPKPRMSIAQRLFGPYPGDDFWEWTLLNYPTIHDHPRLAAFRKLRVRYASSGYGMFVTRAIIVSKNRARGSPRSRAEELLAGDIEQLYRTALARYPALDLMLEGSPLIWPPADEVADLRRRSADGAYPEVNVVRSGGEAMIVAAMMKSEGDGAELIRNWIRLLLLDRRLTIEYPYPAVPSGIEDSTSIMGEWIENPIPVSFGLDRIAPADARRFMTRLPEPKLEERSGLIQRLGLHFKSDRAQRNDTFMGYLHFRGDYSRQGVFIGSRENPFIVEYLKGFLRKGELVIKYPLHRRARMEALVATQLKVREALRSETSLSHHAIFGTGDRQSSVEEWYLILATRIDQAGARNDVRLLFHAIMIARAHEEKPEGALEELERYSKKFVGGRLEAAAENDAIRLTLGERSKVVPRFGGGGPIKTTSARQSQ